MSNNDHQITKGKPERPVLQGRDRLTLCLHMYHEHPPENPREVEARYSDMLDNIEEPYQRRMKVDEVAREIDTGWVENPGHIIIENLTGKEQLQYSPSTEYLAELAKKVLYVFPGESSDRFEIPPKRLQLFNPFSGRLAICCAYKETFYRITVFPR